MGEHLRKIRLASIARGESTYSFNNVIEEIYNDIYEDCYKLSYRLTQSIQKSKDLVQDVFTHILTRDKIKIASQIANSDGTIKGYFCKAIINRFRNDIRKSVIKLEMPIEIEDSRNIEPLDFLFLHTNINRALNQLSINERTIFCLKVFEGWSHKTIYEMGYTSSEANSKTIVCRARLKLTNMLKDYSYTKK